MSYTWQRALKEAITDPRELIQQLELDSHLLEAAQKAAQLFPLKVPRRFIAQIQKGNPADPLLRQILPLADEHQAVAEFVSDPLQESLFNPLPGLLHKYHGRVLLTVTGACGIHCRFCFRRNFPYEKNQLGSEGREAILSYLSADQSISEVILSGGDPMVAPDQLLATLTQQLSTIPHIKRLRIHTRLPIMLPERITPSLIDALISSRLQLIMVLHCNHPNELSEDWYQAMQSLRQAGVTLLNQTVLLTGVNDDVDILTDLNENLFAAGVLPYYLHLPDKVRGTAHFDICPKRAIALYDQMNARLPGYLVPRLVTEIPGCSSKILLQSKHLYTGHS